MPGLPVKGVARRWMVIILATKLILGTWKDIMNKRWVLGIPQTVGAGIAGGLAFIILTFVTFVLIGHGPLSNPGLQSPKVLAVLNELEPLPLFATKPHVIFLGYLLFSISHALLFRSVADAWPAGAAPRIWRLALVGWSLSYLFFEFLGPFNLLGEPLGLVALELCFWAAAALVESAVIVLILQRDREPREARPVRARVAARS